MKNITHSTYEPSPGIRAAGPLHKRISWGAVFAGVTTAVIIQLLLTLLGVAIGAATVDPLREGAPGEGLGIGAAIWFFVSTIIAMYVAGRVAGRLSGAATKQDRMAHGLFTWATTSILSVIFLATAVGSLLGGAASMLGSAAGTAVQSQSAKTGNPQAGVSVSATAPGAANQDPAVVAQREQKAREVADTAAKRVSQSAMWSLFALVLSGLAAAMGGRSSYLEADSYPREQVEVNPTRLEPHFAKS